MINSTERTYAQMNRIENDSRVANLAANENLGMAAASRTERYAYGHAVNIREEEASRKANFFAISITAGILLGIAAHVIGIM